MRSGSVGCVDRRSSSPTTAVVVERDDHGVGHMDSPVNVCTGREEEENALISEYHYTVVSGPSHFSQLKYIIPLRGSQTFAKPLDTTVL